MFSKFVVAAIGMVFVKDESPQLKALGNAMIGAATFLTVQAIVKSDG